VRRRPKNTTSATPIRTAADGTYTLYIKLTLGALLFHFWRLNEL
jgi:hypothetical protein